MTKFLLASVIAMVLVPRSVRAQLLPHPPVVDHLPNGLTLVTVQGDSPGVAAYYTLVRTGSRDELEAGHTGYAHLFEHMMFRGSETVPPEEYERRIQLLGVAGNAYTAADMTVYTNTLPARSLPDLIALEADRFQHLSFATAPYQTETRAVLGEFNKDASDPRFEMEQSLAHVAFTHHTYGHDTIGSFADVYAMPREAAYARNFFRRFYRPDNCTIVVVGDVAHDAVLADVTRAYGAWRGHRAVTNPAVEPAQTAPRSRALAWTGPAPRLMFVAYRIPAFDLAQPDTAALEVLHELAFSASSALYQRLVVHDAKLISLESARGELHRDPYLFRIAAQLAPGTTFDEIEHAITEELTHIAHGEIARERFDAVVSNLRYAIPMELQTPADIADALAQTMALTGEPATLEHLHARLATVTADDVAHAAATWLTPEHRTIVTLAPQADAAPDAVRAGPGVDRAHHRGGHT